MHTPTERARKMLALVLNKMTDTTQKAVAAAMGVSEPTITRMKTDEMGSSDIQRVMHLLAHLGYKIVEQDRLCIPRDQYDVLVKTYTRIATKAPHLMWDDAE